MRRCAVIAWLCGTMVAAGADGLDNWHVRNQPPTGDDLRAVAFGNGWFVALGDEPGGASFFL